MASESRAQGYYYEGKSPREGISLWPNGLRYSPQVDELLKKKRGQKKKKKTPTPEGNRTIRGNCGWPTGPFAQCVSYFFFFTAINLIAYVHNKTSHLIKIRSGLRLPWETIDRDSSTFVGYTFSTHYFQHGADPVRRVRDPLPSRQPREEGRLAFSRGEKHHTVWNIRTLLGGGGLCSA